jgi:hypothetical protein
MKKTSILLSFAAIIAVIALNALLLSGCPGTEKDDTDTTDSVTPDTGTSDTGTPEPPLADFTSAPVLALVPDNGKITYIWTAPALAPDNYDVYWKAGNGLSAADVKTGIKIPGATSGGEITVLTNGTEYSVIVTANKDGYKSIDSDVKRAIPAIRYVITGNGSTFTATKGSVTIGTADDTIQNVINAIRGDANGEACDIQFGDGTAALDIGTASASFSGAWGFFVELSGKITGNVNTATTGTIVIEDAVSITSVADITNNGGINGRAIYHNSTGTVNISGGTVSATTGYAVYNGNTGKITVSGTARVSSANVPTSLPSTGGTIYLSNSGTKNNVRLEILGGTVENTSTISIYAKAICNDSSGAITISGGEVKGGYYAVYISGGASTTVSGGTISTTGNSDSGYGYSIHNSGVLTISGGTVLATEKNSTAVYNTNRVTISGGTVSATGGENSKAVAVESSAGALTISGGTVSATTGNAILCRSVSDEAVTISGGTVRSETGCAVYNQSTGRITVSQPKATPTLVTSANANAEQATIFLANAATSTSVQLLIKGGTVQNTSTATGNAIRNNSVGAITISGGTVSATGNSSMAIYSYSPDFYGNLTGKITVSQAAGATTLITSADTNTKHGTIYLEKGTTNTERLLIEGGTVQNTSATTGNAIYNASFDIVRLTGGTVSVTGTSARAIHNDTNGPLTITGGTVSATGASGCAIYNDFHAVVTITSPPAVIVGKSYP